MTGLTGSHLREQVSTGVLAGVNRSSERNTNRIHVSRRAVRWGLVGLALVVLLVLSAGAVSADPESVGECTVIEEDGAYELNGNITSGDGTCIEITASDVILDGNGHTIDGQAGSGTAIQVSAAENVTIRNVVVESWSTGIAAQGIANSTLADVEVRDAESDGAVTGVQIHEAVNTTVRNLTVENQHYTGTGDPNVGLELADVVETTVENLDVHGLGHGAEGSPAYVHGLLMDNATDTVVTNATIGDFEMESVEGSVAGIVAHDSEHTTVTDTDVSEIEIASADSGVAGFVSLLSADTTLQNVDINGVSVADSDLSFGIDISDSEGSTILGSTVTNISSGGDVDSTAGIHLTDVTDTVVDGVVIETVESATAPLSGLAVSNATETTIHDLDVYGLGHTGEGSPAYVHGLLMDNTTHTTVTDANVGDFEMTSVEGSVVGIVAIDSEDTMVADTDISEIEIGSAGHGVGGFVSSSSDSTTIQNVDIDSVSVGTSDLSFGIDVRDSERSTIFGSTVTNISSDDVNSVAGIHLTGVADTVVDEVVIESVESAEASVSGLAVSDAFGTTVQDTSIANVTGSGIEGPASSVGIDVEMAFATTIDGVVITNVRADSEVVHSAGIVLRQFGEVVAYEEDDESFESQVDTMGSTIRDVTVTNVTADGDSESDRSTSYGVFVENHGVTVDTIAISDVRVYGGNGMAESAGITLLENDGTSSLSDSTVLDASIANVSARGNGAAVESKGISVAFEEGTGDFSEDAESSGPTIQDSDITNVTARSGGEENGGDIVSSGIEILYPELTVQNTTITEVTAMDGELTFASGVSSGILREFFIPADGATIVDSKITDVEAGSGDEAAQAVAFGGVFIGEDITIQGSNVGNVAVDSHWGSVLGLYLFTTDSVISGNTIENGTHDLSEEDPVFPSSVGMGVLGTENTFSDNLVRSFDTGIFFSVVEGPSFNNDFHNTTIRDTPESAIESVNEGQGSNTFEGVNLGYEGASLSADVQDVRLNAVDAEAQPPVSDEYDDIGVFFTATPAVSEDDERDEHDEIGVAEVTPTDTAFVNVTIDYDESAVTHVDEETLALWKYSDGWNKLDSTLDTDARTVSHNITDFSTFALFAEAVVPATPQVSDLDVAGQGPEATITEGDAEDVTVTVENAGEESDTFTVELALENGDSVEETEQTSELAPGENETVVFEAVTGGLGPDTYDVTVSAADDSVSGSLTVEADEEDPEPTPDPTPAPDPEPEPEDLSIEKSLNTTFEDLDQLQIDVRHASPHQAFDLWLNMPNATVAPHEAFDLRAARDNVTLDQEMAGFEDLNVTLEMSDVSLENVTFTTRTSGYLNLTINGSSDALPTTPDEEFPVAGLADLAYMSLNASFASDDVAFRFRLPAETIEELQSETETVTMYEFHEEFGGWAERSTEFVEEDEETETLVFETTASEFAYSEWAVVAERPVFEIVDTDVDATTVTVGESVTVEATVANTGTLDGEYGLDLLVDGGSVDGQSVTVEAGATEQGTFTYTFTEAGEYTLEANDEFVADVTVEAEEAEPDDDEPPEDDTEETDDTDDVVETDDADDDGTGLGVVAAVLAMLALAVYSVRRIAGKTNT